VYCVIRIKYDVLYLGGVRIRIRPRRSRVERMGFGYSLYNVFRVWCLFRVWDLSIPSSVMCECSFSQIWCLETWWDLRTLDSQIDCCFRVTIYCLALRGWMRVKIGWFATSQLRQQPCVRHSFSPRITALNLTRSHQYLPLLSVFLWSIIAHLFSLWNCVPRFAESLPVSGVFVGLFSGLPAELGVTGFYLSLYLSLWSILADLFALWNCISRFGKSLPVSGVLWSFFYGYVLNRGLTGFLGMVTRCKSQSKLQRTGFGHRVRKSRRSWRGGCQSSKLAFRTRNRKSLASV